MLLASTFVTHSEKHCPRLSKHCCGKTSLESSFETLCLSHHPGGITLLAFVPSPWPLKSSQLRKVCETFAAPVAVAALRALGMDVSCCMHPVPFSLIWPIFCSQRTRCVEQVEVCVTCNNDDLQSLLSVSPGLFFMDH